MLILPIIEYFAFNDLIYNYIMKFWQWGSPIKLGKKQIAKSNLDLLEIILWNKRTSILVDLNKKWYKASCYENVKKYILEKLWTTKYF